MSSWYKQDLFISMSSTFYNKSGGGQSQSIDIKQRLNSSGIYFKIFLSNFIHLRKTAKYLIIHNQEVYVNALINVKDCTVNWSWRIHRLHFWRGVRSSLNECPVTHSAGAIKKTPTAPLQRSKTLPSNECCGYDTNTQPITPIGRYK